MSSSTSPAPSSGLQPQSYTQMAIGDVEAIGAHCQMAYCHQLDFLPFRCESCGGKFCGDHRTETAHSCPKAGVWAARRRENAHTGPTTQKPSLYTHDRQCSSPSCKSLIYTSLTTGVHCDTCNRDYCLKHRMQEDHDCKNLKPIGARTSEAQKAANSALARFKSWNLKNKLSNQSVKISSLSNKKSSAAAAQAEINTLKRTAKGEASIPQEKRLYLHVEASADTTKAKYPTGKFFYNKEWSVGRILDIAAKALQVENVNNRGGGEEDKLRVFHVEGGRLLEFSEKIGAPCQTGNTIVLLRGVGPAVPDLIEA